MSTRLELRSRMAELAKEHGKLNAELKDMDEVERRAKSHELFKDFQFKVRIKGYTIDTEEEIVAVTDDDRERSSTGGLGLTYCDVDHSDSLHYLMMRSKEEYPRLKLLFTRLEAAAKINDKNEKDRERHVRTLLGEANEP